MSITSSRILRRLGRIGCAICLVGGAVCTTVAGESSNDPLKRQPAQERPAFRQLLKTAAYQNRFDKFLSSIGDLKELKRSNRPIHGSRITQVARGEQGDQLGLEAGDIIEQINGQEIWSTNYPDGDSPRRLRYFDVSESLMQTGRVAPGKIGIWSVTHWQPELQYLRNESRRGVWDKEVLVGIVARESDPDLAETAWHRAVKLGYNRDYFSAQFGIAIALAQGRPEIAADFADFARQANAEKGQRVHPLLMYRAALANYQLTEALRLVRSHPLTFDINPDVLLYEIDRHSNLSPDDRELPVPHQQAAAMYRDDLLPRAQGREYFSIKDYLPTLQRGDVLKLGVSAGNYKYVFFGPSYPVRNIDLTVRVKAKPTSDAGSEWAKLVEVGLLRDVDQSRNEIMKLRLQQQNGDVQPGSLVRPSHSAGLVSLEYSDATVHLDGKQEQEIRLIRIGGRGEIFLNGKRVLYGPVPEHANQMNVYIRTIGTTIEVTSLKLAELIEKP